MAVSEYCKPINYKAMSFYERVHRHGVSACGSRFRIKGTCGGSHMNVSACGGSSGSSGCGSYSGGSGGCGYSRSRRESAC